jgi:hypothetical protein
MQDLERGLVLFPDDDQRAALPGFALNGKHTERDRQAIRA